MINLLPDHDKRILRAAQSNWLLARYVALAGIVVAILLFILIAGWLYLRSIEANATQRIEENNRSIAALSSEMREVREFEQNLTIARQILEKEVNYSAIILRYASIIPGGTIIESLTLDPSIVGSTSTFTAKAKTERTVLQFKDALSNSPYFSEVRFSDISVGESSDEYPYTVAISLTINRDLLTDNKEVEP